MPLLYSKDDTDSLLRPRALPAKRMSARAIAECNAVKTLAAVARYSHLRTSEVAAIVYPTKKYAVQLGQRIVRRLVAAGLLAQRANSLGSMSVVLTRPGAAFLEVRGIPARHGLDVSSVNGGTCRHSILCTCFCIAQEAAGFNAWHEYAIAQGQAPLTQTQLIEVYGKLPDAILTRGKKLYLVECEVAPKDSAILAKACGVVARSARRFHPDVDLELDGLIFVFDASLAHHVRIARAARLRWADRSESDRRALATRITLARATIRLPMQWVGCTLSPLAL